MLPGKRNKMAIGQYLHNLKVIDFEQDCIPTILVIITIIPLWWWCMYY